VVVAKLEPKTNDPMASIRPSASSPKSSQRCSSVLPVKSVTGLAVTLCQHQVGAGKTARLLMYRGSLF
jgi:hypothetical protein